MCRTEFTRSSHDFRQGFSSLGVVHPVLSTNLETLSSAPYICKQVTISRQSTGVLDYEVRKRKGVRMIRMRT